jgi:hypothetical protein
MATRTHAACNKIIKQKSTSFKVFIFLQIREKDEKLKKRIINDDGVRRGRRRIR